MAKRPARSTRVERDSFGPMRVPAGALYGAQTQRAVENFPISGLRLPKQMRQAFGLIKKAAAQTNAELGVLDKRLARGIAAAARGEKPGGWAVSSSRLRDYTAETGIA